MATSKNITRRAFVNAAATTAAGVSALTVNAASAARPSRLGEVTAAFEVARKAFMGSADAESAAEEAWLAVDRKDPILGPMVNGCRVEVRGRDRDEAYDDQEKAISQFGHKLRRELTSIGADTSAVDEWELRMTEEAIAAVDKWAARRSGYTAAEVNVASAIDAENDALLAVLEYRPVSPDDARAKAQWICERLERHEISGLHCAFECLLESTLPEGEELHEQGDGSWLIVSGGAVS